MTLIGYWPLVEDSGSTAYDYSGNENHGTVNGVTQGALGILGSTAYSFNGTGDYISNTIPCSKLGSKVMFTGWIYPRSTGRQTILSGYRDGTSSRWDIEYDTDGNQNLMLVQYEGTTVKTNNNSTIPVDKWTHFAFYFNQGSNGIWYINGAKDGSGTPKDENLDDGAEISVAARPDGSAGGSSFDGRMSGVRVYNRALTPQEVAYLYQISQKGSYVSSKKTV